MRRFLFDENKLPDTAGHWLRHLRTRQFDHPQRHAEVHGRAQETGMIRPPQRGAERNETAPALPKGGAHQCRNFR